MPARQHPAPADTALNAAPNMERLAKVAGECVVALGPVLGLQACRALGQLKLAPSGLSGMAVMLEGGSPAIVIGVLSNPAGRAAIARALFQMNESEQPQASDENDAVGELANVIAGRIKVALSQPSLRLSVPAAISAEEAPRGEQVTLRLSFGSVPAALVVGFR